MGLARIALSSVMWELLFARVDCHCRLRYSTVINKQFHAKEVNARQCNVIAYLFSYSHVRNL